MTAIEAGDIVEIRPSNPELAAWHGLRCSVIRVIEAHAELQPLCKRPDEFEMSPLVWGLDQLLLVSAIPEPDATVTPPKLDERYSASARWADGRVEVTGYEWRTAKAALDALEAGNDHDLRGATLTVRRRYVSEWVEVAQS